MPPPFSGASRRAVYVVVRFVSCASVKLQPKTLQLQQLAGGHVCSALAPVKRATGVRAALSTSFGRSRVATTRGAPALMATTLPKGGVAARAHVSPPSPLNA